MRLQLLLLLLFPLSLSAQINITLTDGSVPFSDLLLEVEQCSKTEWKRTNANGVLQISPTTDCDSLRLHFEDIAYGRLDSVFLLPKATDSLVLTLTTLQQSIDEVRISGFRSKSNARGRTYLIDSTHFQPHTKTITALQRLPGIIPTGINSISLFGAKDAPVYYVDDLVADASFVANLDIHDIERVEIRTVSLAVDGDGGEIYIYRKKRNYNLLRSEIGSAADYTWGNDRLGWLGFGNLYHQSRKSDLFLNIGRDVTQELQDQYKRFATHNYTSEKREDIKQKKARSSAVLRWNYTLNKHVTVQVDGDYFLRDTRQEIELKSPPEKQNRKFRTDDVELRATVKTKLSDEIVFYTRGLYSIYNSDLRYQNPTTYHRLNQGDQTALGELLGEFGAYSLGITKHTLTALYRFSYGSNTSDRRYYSSTYISRFGLSDLIELGSDFSLYLGCRYDRDLNLFAHQGKNTKHYFFPTLTLSYNSAWGETTLKLKQEVTRPDITHLDSSTRWWGAEKQIKGNPDLLPIIFNQYYLGQSKSFGKHSLDLSVFYITSRNIIHPIYMANNTMGYYASVAAADYTSFDIYYSMNLLDYTLYIGLYGGLLYSNYWLYPKYRTTSRLIAKDSWSVQLAPSIHYAPNRNFSAEIYFAYASESISISELEKYPFQMTVMLKYGFLDDRLQLRLSSINVLSPWITSEETLQLTDYSFYTRTSTPFAFRLALSYEFGKKFESRAEKTIKADDYSSHLE